MTTNAYYNEIDPYAAQWLRNLIKAGHIAPAMLTNGVLRMSNPMIYENSLSAISLQESASGHMHCDKLDGLTTSQSGQALALANLSARQAKAAGLMMSGTCGPHSFTSSSSAGRQQCLVSRLQAKTALHGSTLYKLTWKVRITPQQRSIFALRASVRRTSGSAFSGWPTPTTRDCKGVSGLGRQIRKGNFTDTLANASAMAGWTTPTAGNGKGSKTPPLRQGGMTLNGQVLLAGWPTPLATEARLGYQNRNTGKKGTQESLTTVVESGTFPLVDGITNRVGRLRAYGNAINASTAEAFIRAYLATPLWMGFDLAGVTE